MRQPVSAVIRCGKHCAGHTRYIFKLTSLVFNQLVIRVSVLFLQFSVKLCACLSLCRMVENEDGPVGASTRASLLMKAVEDCFIGRHFIFGIKVQLLLSIGYLNSSCNDVLILI